MNNHDKPKASNIINKETGQALTFDEFHKAFQDSDQADRFSVEGLQALYGFFNDLGDAEEIEMDIHSFCAEFTEYAASQEALRVHGLHNIEQLESRTYVVQLENGGLCIEKYRGMKK